MKVKPTIERTGWKDLKMRIVKRAYSALSENYT